MRAKRVHAVDIPLSLHLAVAFLCMAAAVAQMACSAVAVGALGKQATDRLSLTFAAGTFKPELDTAAAPATGKIKASE